MTVVAQKKVLIVVNPSVGGSELNALKMAETLDAEFSWVFLLRHNQSIEKRFLGRDRVFKLDHSSGGTLASIFCSGAIGQICKSNNIHVIYAVGFQCAISASIAKLLFCSVRLIITHRGVMSLRKIHHKLLWVYVRMMADRIETNAKHMMTRTTGGSVSFESKYYFVPNIIRVDKTKGQNEGTLPDAITRNQYLVGYVGNVRHQKNPELLFASIKMLLSNRADVNVIVCGDDRVGRLTKLFQSDKFKDRFFLLENQEQHQIDNIYDALDVLFFTSSEESSPNVLIEAMANKVPIVSTNIMATRELITTGVNGVLLEQNNARNMVMEITALLDKRAVRATLAENAFKRYKTDFCIKDVKQILEQAFAI